MSRTSRPASDFIRISAVSKHFGKVTAVDEVSLAIAQGEFFALLGPSGCGKTTLLRMLGGFEIPSAGEIDIDGEPMAVVPPYRRPVNMVFQSYAIFPHLNVFQNIAFGLRKEGLSRAELVRRVDEALALIRLEGYGDRAAHQLSGGQRQRVALARALIKKPKVLLLDEPLGALDKKLREHMQIELRDLQKALGITFVFVTHDQEEAFTMADRMAVMVAGKVVEVGSPSELYARPKTRFVANFIGTMNLFAGKVHSREGDVVMVEAETLGLVSVPAAGRTIAAGQTVTVGLRPENVRIAPRGGEAGLDGIVAKRAYLGDRTQVFITVGGDREPVLAALQNTEGTAGASGEGAAVTLNWSPAALVLLVG